MKTFSIDTLGCKVNQYESQQIRELLEQFGLTQLETSERKSDLVVINTCCVTHTASAKSRQCIHKAQRLNPKAVIIVAGCLPSVQIGELNNPGKNVHLIRHRHTLAATLSQIVNGKAEQPQPVLGQLASFKGQTRAFLKVQDGCDGYCSYCIIPKTRPVVHSKPVETVLAEAQKLVEAGHKEIVLTGVNLGAYGQKTVRRERWDSQENSKLADLLDRMAEIANVARIRLSSLEPADVTPGLLDIFCKHRNIMPHLHLSLQSGSEAILKKMYRQYGAEEFKEKAELIKRKLDRPAITADIIVGFPGETDEDFQQTVETAKQIGFAKMHVFSFSPRKGTAAASMRDVVDNKVIKQRSKLLRKLGVELGRKFRQQFIGETATILMENNNGQPGGRSERYFKVKLKNGTPSRKKNELVKVKLLENSEDGLNGQALRR
ncbi:MAG: tRNA (N(6)-L-threonylcarbamoyladenosine(37)-C(2))-methylthiotransferase MtaB [Planctomycetota bacterium]|nr:MAG: tRNA (N(6)-L-threonylcarbamoyladenosine(37)-C(2))-methylthiotransferase MtaB [Planctomycetota bacterium]